MDKYKTLLMLTAHPLYSQVLRVNRCWNDRLPRSDQQFHMLARGRAVWGRERRDQDKPCQLYQQRAGEDHTPVYCGTGEEGVYRTWGGRGGAGSRDRGAGNELDIGYVSQHSGISGLEC